METSTSGTATIHHGASGRFPGDYLSTVRQALRFMTVLLRRNLVLIGSVVVLAAGAGAARWYAETPAYESTLVCAFNNQRYPRKTFGEMAQKLDILARTGSSGELGRLLGLSPAQAASILSVEGRNRAGSALHEDITELYEPLYFVVRAKDRSVFAPLESGLVNYMSSTPQQLLLERLSVANLAVKINLLEADLHKTDTLLDAYAAAIRTGAIDYRDTAGRPSALAALLQHRTELTDKLVGATFKKELETGSSVVVMHGFAPPDKPARGSKKIIAGAALLGFLAAFGWALLRTQTHTSRDA